MNKLLFCVGFLLFIQVALASFGYRQHHHAPHSEFKKCHWQAAKGSFDLRLLMRDMNNKDWVLRDQRTQSTFSFSPCGGVQNPACPPGTALCEITEKNIAVSWGQASNISWAELHDTVGVELSYANGELCDNDVPRKTVIEMSCSKPTETETTFSTVITDMTIDSCLITIKVTSPYGCPLEELCTVYKKETCTESEGLCHWKDEKCEVTTSPCLMWGRHHLSPAAMLGVMASLAVLFSCGCLLCVCTCVKRRRTLRRKAQLPTTSKKQKKNKKNATPTTPAVPEPQFIYQPMQQLQPLSGGQFAQLHPYGFNSEENGFPMVQFIPTSASTSIQQE